MATPTRIQAMSPGQTALALSLLLGLQPVTTDLYLPALPQLARALQAPMSAVQLTMSALLLSFGLSQLLMGPLSDRLGRRPVLLGGLALYTLASLLATLAPDIGWLIAGRALQGVGMAASVVCARAMVRDLYAPAEGAQVMSKGLSGLGVLALVSPTLGGLLAAFGGWRAALAGVTLIGAGVLWHLWRHVPETRQPHPGTASPGLWQQARRVARHPTFIAWTLLTSATYGGLFVLLAGGSFVYIGTLGLAPWQFGLVMAASSATYLAGTVLCRRWLRAFGMAGAVRRGAWFTLAGGLGMLALAWAGVQWLPAILLTHCLFALGHGIHQPCGQTGAVGAFPQSAGVASALSGFVLALTAFCIGLWLGQVMDGRLLVLASGLAFCSVVTAGVAWSLVQRHGEHFSAPTAAATRA